MRCTSVLPLVVSASALVFASACGGGNSRPNRAAEPDGAYFVRDVPGEHGAGMPEQTCRGGSYASWRGEGLPQTDGAEARRLDETLELLEERGEQDADYPALLYRAAQGYRDIAIADTAAAWPVFSECMTAYVRCESTDPCYEPVPVYTEAFPYFEELSTHRNFAMHNEAQYLYADARITMGELDAGLDLLDDIVSLGGSSELAGLAALRAGDELYEIGELSRSRDYFRAAFNNDDPCNVTYAQYMVGWTYASADNWSECQSAWVEAWDQNEGQSDCMDREQLEDDVLYSLAMDDLTNVERAVHLTAWFGLVERDDMLLRLLELYEDWDQDQSAAALEQELVQWQTSLPEALWPVGADGVAHNPNP